MAIKIVGTIIVNDSRVMSNIASAAITGAVTAASVTTTGVVKSAGLQDSSSRTLLIKNSAGTVVWGN